MGDLVEVKAFLLKAQVAALKETGRYEEVRRLLPEETAAYLDKIPLLAWVPSRHPRALTDAMGKLGGRELVREVTARSIESGIAQVVMPFVSSLMSILGVSPASVFSKLDAINEVSTRGIPVEYEALAAAEANIHVIYSETPSRFDYAAWEVTLEGIFRRVGVSTGVVEYLGMSSEGRRLSYRVRW